MIAVAYAPGFTSNGPTRVLLAVLDEYALKRRVTYDDLVRRTRLNRSTIHRHLEQLRDHGLVTWEDGHVATLRPTSRRVR